MNQPRANGPDRYGSRQGRETVLQVVNHPWALADLHAARIDIENERLAWLKARIYLPGPPPVVDQGEPHYRQSQTGTRLGDRQNARHPTPASPEPAVAPYPVPPLPALKASCERDSDQRNRRTSRKKRRGPPIDSERFERYEADWSEPKDR
jgi:hypothetical protein